METNLLNEVIDCLPKDRTLFRYARDDYALMLLSRFAGNGKSVADIKRSQFRGLLEKPVVKQLVSSCGSGLIKEGDFKYCYAEDKSDFVLTVGKWDRDNRGFSQTTRDSGNLVLQVNFNSKFDNYFHRLIGGKEIRYFKCYTHPILKKGERSYFRNTLGWARLDLDFDTGEVLIEEIQNDWLRGAKYYLTMMTRYIARHPDYRQKLGIIATQESIEKYVKNILGPLYRIWDEAILTAAIKFSVEELGINRVYYHTYDTGSRLKRIRYTRPPRSLYTDLPKKFCFNLTNTLPEFLKNSKVVIRKLKKIKNPHWYELSV